MVFTIKPKICAHYEHIVQSHCNTSTDIRVDDSKTLLETRRNHVSRLYTEPLRPEELIYVEHVVQYCYACISGVHREIQTF